MPTTDLIEKFEKNVLKKSGLLYFKNSPSVGDLTYEPTSDIWAIASWEILFPDKYIDENYHKATMYLVDSTIVDRNGYVAIRPAPFMLAVSSVKSNYSLVAFATKTDFFIKPCSMLRSYLRKTQKYIGKNFIEMGANRIQFIRIKDAKNHETPNIDKQYKEEMSHENYIAGTHMIVSTYEYIMHSTEFTAYFDSIDIKYDDRTKLLAKVYAKI